MKAKFFISKVIFLLLLSYIVQAQTGVSVPALAKFDEAMLKIMNKYRIPGGQLAITYQGRLVYSRGFGYANVNKRTMVQPHTIFRIASISKPITAIAIMYLIETGHLSLQDKVFGPNGILNDDIYAKVLDKRVYNITIENLLNHSGGWNSSQSGDPMFNPVGIANRLGVPPPANASQIISFVLANKNLDFSPGTADQYSNLGYNILGRVIEKITEQSYEEFVRTSILNPMGINDMYLGFNKEADRYDIEANYYDYPNAPKVNSVYDGQTLVPFPYAGFNLEAMDAHGGWLGSAEDLCKILLAVDGYDSRPDLLSPQTIRLMTKPSRTNPGYSLGWAVNAGGNYWHAGSLPGTSSFFVRTNQELNWAIIFNTRSQNIDDINNDIDALVWNVLPSIRQMPDIDLFEK
jgi:CubicO group peptidase (beta-lactamase class C family)